MINGYEMQRQQAPLLWIGKTFMGGEEVALRAHLCRDAYPRSASQKGVIIGLYEVVGRLDRFIPGLETYVDVGTFMAFFKGHFKVKCVLRDLQGNFTSTGPVMPIDDSMGAGWSVEELWLMSGGSLE